MTNTRDRFIPVHEFMGEHYISELGHLPDNGAWGWVSYECSARLSEMYRDNPNLLERDLIFGKSGAKYFGYRLRPGYTIEDMQDNDLRDFYTLITTPAIVV